MTGMLAIRNIRLFFRDRTHVFFSLLAVFIIIGLYVLFLGDMMTRNIAVAVGGRQLTDSWIMAGLLAVTPVTSSLGALGVMVDDYVKKIRKDFLASPVSRGKLSAGYILGGGFSSLLISLLAVVLAQGYILLYGGALFSLTVLLKILGLTFLSVLSGSAVMFFLVSFIKSASAFGTASSLLGTMIGFLTGIYIPFGLLPAPVQAFSCLFPASHAASLFRQVMMEGPISASFAGAPAEAVSAFSRELGRTLTLGGAAIPAWVSLLWLGGSALLFYGLSILRLRAKQ